MSPVVIFSPAKLNLLLAITGRRADGFHDLVSVVAPVKFGDTLQAHATDDGKFTLECNDPAVPLDDTNLILRAAKLFREAAALPTERGVRFKLDKRIPMGAGLGGGSSNAVAALQALNQLAPKPLAKDVLLNLAVKLGSDCALFLHAAPVVIRGRGENVERLPSSAAARLSGRRVMIFKPGFGIATAWAYGRMAAGAPGSYLAPNEAEAKLAHWISSGDSAETLLFNNMERPAFAKYIALPALLEKLRTEFSLAVAMSGSGSACFALLRENTPLDAVVKCVREAWGMHTFILDTEIV
ncbi:MAG: 4-(cytidine 5'-diphospho)-2-C-methyl-D-erythritol kinase [Nibricoccus sp.]